MKILIRDLAFTNEGDVHLSYILPEEDVKAIGVARIHSLVIPRASEYGPEIDAVEQTAIELVRDVLGDFPTLEAADLEEL